MQNSNKKNMFYNKKKMFYNKKNTMKKKTEIKSKIILKYTQKLYEILEFRLYSGWPL